MDENQTPNEGTTDFGVLNTLGQDVAGVSEEAHDTMPPAAPTMAELQLENERIAERQERIEQAVAQVLPKVKARNIGHDPRHPWLSNPHMEATVRATIEELYDLRVG